MKTIFEERYAALIDLFRQRRVALGLRQSDVAAKLDLCRNVISKIELRERRADICELYDLAQLLGIPFRRIETILRQEKR